MGSVEELGLGVTQQKVIFSFFPERPMWHSWETLADTCQLLSDLKSLALCSFSCYCKYYFKNICFPYKISFWFSYIDCLNGQSCHNSLLLSFFADTPVCYQVEGSRQALRVTLYLDSCHFSELPSRLQNGGSLKLHTVLFTRGKTGLGTWRVYMNRTQPEHFVLF